MDIHEKEKRDKLKIQRILARDDICSSKRGDFVPLTSIDPVVFPDGLIVWDARSGQVFVKTDSNPEWLIVNGGKSYKKAIDALVIGKKALAEELLRREILNRKIGLGLESSVITDDDSDDWLQYGDYFATISAISGFY